MRPQREQATGCTVGSPLVDGEAQEGGLTAGSLSKWQELHSTQAQAKVCCGEWWKPREAQEEADISTPKKTRTKVSVRTRSTHTSSQPPVF